MADSTRGFHVELLSALRRSPWWLASLLVHSLFLGAPALVEDPAPAVRAARVLARVAPAPGAVLEEINPDIIEEMPLEEVEVVVMGPVVQDAMIADHCETDDIAISRDSGWFASDAPFAGPSTNAAVGIGGGAGGAFGGRGGHRNLKACGACGFGGGAGARHLLVIEADPAATDEPPTFRGLPLTEGMLLAQEANGGELGSCPLLTTRVSAEITAFLSRVTLTQRFENPFPEKIHAVYVFPLPRNAAVTDFLLTIGDREIRGVVRERAEARRIFEEAKAAGFTASLVTQERPNVFVQEVSNLMPGRPVDTSLTYLHPLRVRDGAFEFVFPMVVMPRFRAESRIAVGTPPRERDGREFSIEVALDAGVALESVDCPSHHVETDPGGEGRAVVRLLPLPRIPNRDFVLRYRTGGDDAEFGVLAHRSGRGGFFALLATPKADPAPDDLAPREIVFVLDCSGSMSGDPIEKAKAVVRHALGGMRGGDTFRIHRFSNRATSLSERALAATAANLRLAHEYVESLESGGGTEMLAGIRAALAPPIEPGRARMVCFLTDGFIGDEDRILAAVEDLIEGARIFSFGVGGRVNRFLLDKLAEVGRGAVQYVLPETPADAAAERFCLHLRSPWLTDLEVDFGGLPVADVFPERLPDLYPGAPILLVGRYAGGGEAVVTVRGRRAGRPYLREIPVTLPDWEEGCEVLAPVWARCRIESLMDGLRHRPEEARKAITNLGLEFRLVTAFTSFVAVDGSRTEGGEARTLRLPLPDGVVYSGAWSDRGEYCEIRPFGLFLEWTPLGLRVFRVREGSPAEAAGIREGDLVRTVNGARIADGRAARAATADRRDRLSLGVSRQGSRLTVIFEAAD